MEIKNDNHDIRHIGREFFLYSNERFLRPERLPYPVWRRRLPGCAQGTLRAYHSIHAADFIFHFYNAEKTIFFYSKKDKPEILPACLL